MPLTYLNGLNSTLHFLSMWHQESGARKFARQFGPTKEINPLYWRLIDEFGKRTSVPLIMNTSFILRGEAIGHTPTDGIRTFFSSGMDALVIGSYLVEK